MCIYIHMYKAYIRIFQSSGKQYRSAYVCLCRWISMYKYIYVHMLINVYRVHFFIFRVKSNIVDLAHLYNIHPYVRVFLCMYIHVHIYIHINIYIYTYITYTFTYTYTYTYTYKHTYTYLQAGRTFAYFGVMSNIVDLAHFLLLGASICMVCSVC